MKILRRLGKKAHQCVMVEDDLANLKTAYKIGMKTILVSKQNKKNNFCRQAHYKNYSVEIELLDKFF